MDHANANPALATRGSAEVSFEQNDARHNRPTTETQALKFHPLADLFPLMEGAEFEALVADIKANGLHGDIVLYDGMILDGRNRYHACLAAAVAPTTVNGDAWIKDPAAYVISANIQRRHLTAEQKRELVEKLLNAAPEKSDRQIAKIAKVSPTTVGTKRAKMEKAGDVSKLDTRRDTRGRKQPSKKKVAEGKKPKPSQRELEAKQAHINELEAAREHDNDLAEQLQAAKIKIAGLESEVEELKAENTELRAKLDAAEASLNRRPSQETTTAQLDMVDAKPSTDGSPVGIKVKLDPRIVPDPKWPGMYRVRLPDGSLSDMVNLTQAKHALVDTEERCS